MKTRKAHHPFTGVIFGVAVSALALVLVIRWTGWRALLTELEQVDWRFVVLSALVYLISMSARALSWRSIMSDQFTFFQTMGALNEGYLLNNLLPWRMGEIGRAILLGRKGRTSILGVLSTIVVERTYDMLLTVILLTVMLPVAAGLPNLERQAAVAAAVLVLAVVALLIGVFRPNWVRFILKRMPGEPERWLGFWAQFEQGLRVLRDPRTLIVSAIWMVISWSLAGFQYWLMLQAVIPEARLLWAFLMLALTLLGVAVPSSPGYIGVFEAAGVLALSVFGVGRGEALAATLLLHAMVLMLASGLGAVALALEGETLHGLYLHVRNWLADGRENMVV